MENKETQTGVEIDVRHLLSVVGKRLWLFLLVGLLLGGIALGYAVFFITPTYSSSVMFYVNNQYPDSPGFSSSQVTAAQELAQTYMVILETRSVLEEANAAAGLNYTYGQLKGMVSAAAVNDTDVFVVTVTCTSAEHAYLLACAMEQVLPNKINAEVDGSALRMVDGAVQNNNKVGPSYSRYALFGILAGVVISLLFVVATDLLDATIHSEDYLAAAYADVPLLAVIPPAESADKSAYSAYGTKAAQTGNKGRAEK